MGTNQMRPLEKIGVDLAIKLGVVAPDTKRINEGVKTAVYLMRLDVKEYVYEIIKDDMSPAAQKLRASLRRM